MGMKKKVNIYVTSLKAFLSKKLNSKREDLFANIYSTEEFQFSLSYLFLECELLWRGVGEEAG